MAESELDSIGMKWVNTAFHVRGYLVVERGRNRPKT